MELRRLWNSKGIYLHSIDLKGVSQTDKVGDSVEGGHFQRASGSDEEDWCMQKKIRHKRNYIKAIK